ncbi:MAG: tRNA adenosine(34) deaminase TadA [Gammaproteobacteria bacterium]|nr:tRNA adenosine(34) deaminase TadA [Gammaproteobacteria bacterium]
MGINFDSANPAEIDAYWMQHALTLAQRAEAQGEVPVGAVLVLDNQILAEGWNLPISKHDPTAHAEIQTLRAACEKIQNYRLPRGTTLYVTLEPCPMCAGAMVHARVGRVVFAAPDPRTGAAGTVFQLLQNDQLNHRCDLSSGVLESQSAEMLRAFFKARR